METELGWAEGLSELQKRLVMLSLRDESVLRDFWATVEALERSGQTPEAAEHRAFMEVWGRRYPSASHDAV